MTCSASAPNRVLVSLFMCLSYVVLAPPNVALAAPAARKARQDQPNVRATGPTTYSLDLKATPLRQAIQSLFSNAEAQYSLAQDVADTPVTLVLHDQTLNSALQLLLRQAGGAQQLTYTVEAGVYVIKTAPVNTEPEIPEEIHLNNVPPSTLVDRLKTAFPESTILVDTHTSSLVVLASVERLQRIRELIRLLDRAPHTVLLKAEVVMVDGVTSGMANATKTTGKTKTSQSSGGATLLSTVLRTTSGQEATGDDKLLGISAQSAHLQLNATPALLGDGTYQLDTRWDISLPLPTKTAGDAGASGKGGGLIRLEKRLTTTSRLRSGETVVVGGVVLNQYGLKGEVMLFVTLTDVTPADR